MAKAYRQPAISLARPSASAAARVLRLGVDDGDDRKPEFARQSDLLTDESQMSYAQRTSAPLLESVLGDVHARGAFDTRHGDNQRAA